MDWFCSTWTDIHGLIMFCVELYPWFDSVPCWPVPRGLILLCFDLHPLVDWVLCEPESMDIFFSLVNFIQGLILFYVDAYSRDRFCSLETCILWIDSVPYGPACIPAFESVPCGPVSMGVYSVLCGPSYIHEVSQKLIMFCEDLYLGWTYSYSWPVARGLIPNALCGPLFNGFDSVLRGPVSWRLILFCVDRSPPLPID